MILLSAWEANCWTEAGTLYPEPTLGLCQGSPLLDDAVAEVAAVDTADILVALSDVAKGV